MKRLLLISLLFLCLLGWTRADYYSFLHKRVEIITIDQISYIGVVDDIRDDFVCFQRNAFGTCTEYYEFISLFLNQGKQTKLIRAEAIVSIKEIQ